MAQQRVSSIEEQIEDWCKSQFGSLHYFIKTASINPEIEEALKKYPSKKGGTGSNFPDIKYLIETDTMRRIPVMIEVKGTKGALIKLTDEGLVDNITKNGSPNTKSIERYAVNGAVHYAHAILHETESYKEVLSIGVNGYYQTGEAEPIKEIEVWYVSKDNLFVPKKVGSFSDLSFLQPNNLNAFLQQVDSISLTDEEIEIKRLELEDDIERKLKALNQKMHDEQGIAVGDRVKLVAGMIMAGLGVEGKVSPLAVEELKGEGDEENNDGAVIMQKISAYLRKKELPTEKIKMIKDILNKVFLHSKLDVPVNGESHIKTLYKDVKRDIMPFVNGELHNIDFTGKLFNVLNEWVDVPDGDKNDVVLTPRYVTDLMAKLCRVNMDSYVWDFATGSAGFLISAMHQMIADANAKITSPQELKDKEQKIKMEQLLGIEKLPDIYMLAVLNMILMKDGSANIIHGNSLTEFNGKYEQGKHKGEDFPANVFLLNPPYSAEGKGFVFVKKALGMMTHNGRAAILIQENAGSGNGLPYTEDILKKNTLVASIKMSDIFCGKASVQTAIYVFEVGTPHDPEYLVKFIDFSNDGYTRQNRKKSSQNVNLRNTDHALERYDEIFKLVCYGKGINDENLNYYKGKYIEAKISSKGNDWTYGQHQIIDSKPKEEDFQKVVREYLAWRIAQIIKGEGNMNKTLNDIFKDYVTSSKENDVITKIRNSRVIFEEKTLGDLFDIRPTKAYKQTNDYLFSIDGRNPVVTNTSQNNGIGGFSTLDITESGGMIIFSDTTTSDSIFYQPFDFIGYPHVQGLYAKHKEKWSEESLLYLVAAFRKCASGRFDYATKFTRIIASKMKIYLPVTSMGEIDFSFMETYIRAQEKLTIQQILNWQDDKSDKDEQ